MSEALQQMLYQELLRVLRQQLVTGAENSILLRLKVKAWIRDVFDAAVSELLPPQVVDQQVNGLGEAILQLEPFEDDGNGSGPIPSQN